MLLYFHGQTILNKCWKNNELLLALLSSMIPVLKDKRSVHPKTEGKGCNHLGYVYPAWVKRYGCKKNTMFIQPRITGVKWLKLYQDLDLNQIRSWFKTPSKTMGERVTEKKNSLHLLCCWFFACSRFCAKLTAWRHKDLSSQFWYLEETLEGTIWTC